jgi:hypothetical protein
VQNIILIFRKYAEKLIRKLRYPFIHLQLVICLFIFSSAASQSLKYDEIFGNDWQKALSFLEENNEWIESALEKNNISYELAVAVIFPELVRYSALRDKMETTLLKVLYTNLGEDYANFSIGPFQMKPSFAEIIRESSSSLMRRRLKKNLEGKSAYRDEKIYRAEIVADLQYPVSQLNYLVAFIKLCEINYEGCWTDERSKVKFLATVYNTGLNKTAEEIAAMTEKKYFSTKLFKSESYSYSDVALYWYDHYNRAIKLL